MISHRGQRIGVYDGRKYAFILIAHKRNTRHQKAGMLPQIKKLSKKEPLHCGISRFFRIFAFR